jgi:hypothetical protein
VSGRRDDDGTRALESLYPFLSAVPGDVSAVLAQVSASTIAKTRESWSFGA